MKQVLIKQGQVVVEDIPAPQVEPGFLLVRVKFSSISAGTEMSGLKSASQPLWKRALKNPKAVKSTMEMAATRGLTHTRNVIQGKLSEGNPTGYSASGIVLEVGDGIENLQPGDRVACAGAQCAHHAEIICVPRNLTVPLPKDLSLPVASTVTLGAIALQGVRRAQPTLGETFAVIGLGILGQLTTQMLRANGCRVIGADLDASRIELAKSLGMDFSLSPEENNEHILRLTDGEGVDGVIITAASPSDEVISNAFKMCRKKGRVVLVGDVGLNLKREDIFPKELDFFISTSYGPGRYDPQYEEKGLDYPIGYVRWTENRNMAEYLNLISKGKIDIEPLIHSSFEISQAATAYETLKKDKEKPMIVLLSYPESKEDAKPSRVIPNPSARASESGKIKIALAGAGGFIKGMHIPNLQALSRRYQIHAVTSRTGSNASNTAKQVGAQYCTTDYQEILNDPRVDAVLIGTRHHQHASMVLEALQAGKHVLVEKPLALTRIELESIQSFYTTSQQAPVLLTGFNRRFSPVAQRAKKLIENRTNPMIINYRMNAGYIPLDHWVHTEEGGGRNLGEACHIYDLFTFLTESQAVSVQSQSLTPKTEHYSSRDNFVATVGFEDGSVATLTYTALGSNEFPKEQMEIFSDGKVLVLDDYKQLRVHGSNAKGVSSKLTDKGHKRELEAFAETLKKGGEWPIPLWQQLQATEIALQIETQLKI
ncbi:MAG: bi-domain-containing oxidoreductase [Nitrospinota bacterium]|nr:bi-domain-containing oxidoreductase [Nitrospinota bacterium]